MVCTTATNAPLSLATPLPHSPWLANETAGDHFTPREVIRLMVNILFIHDDKLLATPGTVRKLLDPACGTGGMLAEAQNYVREHHGAARLFVYGRDYNKRTFATAASDMLMKQVDHNGGVNNVRYGDSFTEDQLCEPARYGTFGTVSECDLVVTATAAKAPVFDGQWLDEGTHVSGMGSNTPNKRELDGTVFKRSTIVVDFKDQALQEAGDLQEALRTGAILAEAVDVELGDIIAGKKPVNSTNARSPCSSRWGWLSKTSRRRRLPTSERWPKAWVRGSTSMTRACRVRRPVWHTSPLRIHREPPRAEQHCANVRCPEQGGPDAVV